MKIKVEEGKRLKAWEIALLIGLAVFLLSGALSLQTQEVLSDKVVRLHVLANSDSTEDQDLKLQVRDTVLERATELLEQSADRKEAEGLLRGNLLELERLAEKEIHSNGYDYSVTAELSNTNFPTRKYDGFTMPAGEYLALRIVIGEGKGQNWWCVVFPPLCTAVTTDVSMTALAAGLSEEEVNLITGEQGYILKLKVVEFWEALQGKWNWK